MTLEEVEANLFTKDLNKTVQVYFTKESGLHNLNLTSDTVDLIMVDNGFLKIHDTTENCWHCYNEKIVLHYHVPDGWRNKC